MEFLILILSIASVFVQVLSEENKFFIDVHDNAKVWMPNERRVVTCKSITKNTADQIEWISPQGEVVVDRPLRRVYTKKSIQPQKMGYGLNLIFSKTSMTDNGVWLCKSGNLIQTHTVCVIDPTEFDNNNERIVSVNYGSSVKLRCKAQSGNPEPRLQWYRNGEALTDNNNTKYKMLTTSTPTGIEGQLTVVSINAEDAGLYVCQTIQETNENCILTLSMNINLQVQSTSHEITTLSNLEDRAHLACILKRKFQFQWYGGFNDVIKTTFFNTVLHITQQDIDAKLIYMAIQQAPVNSISEGYMRVSKINESYINGPSSEINILLLNYNNNELKDMFVEFMKTDSLSQPVIESDWKPDYRINLQVHNISCYHDQYTVVKIADFDFFEGTEHFVRLRTESKPLPNPDDLVITTDSNQLLYYDHRNLEGLIQDTFKKDIIIQFGIFTICLLILIIFIGITYLICHHCRRNKNNSLPLNGSE